MIEPATEVPVQDKLNFDGELPSIDVAHPIPNVFPTKITLEKQKTILVGSAGDVSVVMFRANSRYAELDIDTGNSANFQTLREELDALAGVKPYVVIDFDQQSRLLTDWVTYPLIHFLEACEGKSEVFVVLSEIPSGSSAPFYHTDGPFPNSRKGLSVTRVDSVDDAFIEIAKRVLEEKLGTTYVGG